MVSYYDRKNFIEAKLRRMSLIHINFDESEVLILKKDAKVSLPDMIGNIGGTLGVFIGFSFLGLLDRLLHAIQLLKRKKDSLDMKHQ